METAIGICLADDDVKKSNTPVTPELFRYLYHFGEPEAPPPSGGKYRPTLRLLGCDSTDGSLTVYRLDGLTDARVLDSAATNAPISMLCLLPYGMDEIVQQDPWGGQLHHISFHLAPGSLSKPLRYTSSSAPVRLSDLGIALAQIEGR